ncbi:MAG: tRNA dihydrouridine synthase DusB [Desulfobacterales bacterium]|nr:tRNA dihydrouridine synthase DusB [Desulfobacterales bacterium]
MQSFKIRNIQIQNRTVLAPLAGFTFLPFRILAKKGGCGLVYSEMVSANGLKHNSKKTEEMLQTVSFEKPLAVQIFGSNPSIMAEAASFIENKGIDIIDINFGCSVKKVVKNGAGAALMKDLHKAESILKEVRKAINIPLTIKIRTGWNIGGNESFELAKIAEDCGVDAIAIHPRAAVQGFRGNADWSIIKKIKEMISITVIGNGDILTAYDALKMINFTGCDAVMVGRVAISDPYIFAKINSVLEGKEPDNIEIISQFEVINDYIDNCYEFFGEKRTTFLLKGKVGFFVRGFPFSSQFRESITKINSISQAKEIIKKYELQLLETIQTVD